MFLKMQKKHDSMPREMILHEVRNSREVCFLPIIPLGSLMGLGGWSQSLPPRVEVEASNKKWRYALEKREIKTSRSITRE